MTCAGRRGVSTSSASARVVEHARARPLCARPRAGGAAGCRCCPKAVRKSSAEPQRRARSCRGAARSGHDDHVGRRSAASSSRRSRALSTSREIGHDHQRVGRAARPQSRERGVDARARATPVRHRSRTASAPARAASAATSSPSVATSVPCELMAAGARGQHVARTACARERPARTGARAPRASRVLARTKLFWGSAATGRRALPSPRPVRSPAQPFAEAEHRLRERAPVAARAHHRIVASTHRHAVQLDLVTALHDDARQQCAVVGAIAAALGGSPASAGIISASGPFTARPPTIGLIADHRLAPHALGDAR